MSVKMCTVGDLKNNLRILQSEARQMKYNGDFDLDGLTKGNPHALLPLYHHVFNSYNAQFTTDVMELIDDSLYMKSDVRFMEAVYRVLRDMFHFKPSMTKEQFFTMNNFAERKIIMCVDVLRLVQQRCRLMGPKCPTNPNIKVAPLVNTRRPSKKSATDLVTQEPNSEFARSAPDLSMSRKSAVKGSTKPMSSLMGIDENNWHLKVGYLQPCKDLPKGEKGPRRGGDREQGTPGEGLVASIVREFSPPNDASGKTGEVTRSPRVDKQEKGHMRAMDALPKASSEWDPTGAVECILAKVRDLPAQLTSFMKAVDGRLQKIEERLEKVEGSGGLHSSEGPSDDKHIMGNLQARLLLLENKLTLMESKKATGTELPAGGKIVVDSSKARDAVKKVLDEKKATAEFTPGPFVSLERGDDLFSGSLVMSSFSPIHEDLIDYHHSNNNDTLTSLAAGEDNRRLSSTPNQSPVHSITISSKSFASSRPTPNIAHSESSLSARPVSSPSLSSAIPAPSPSISSASTADSSICLSPTTESECERRAAEAVNSATADSTIAWETLDTSTQQQVERIRDMLKATQILLPGLGGPQQQVET